MLAASLIFLQHGANQTEKNKNISQAFKAYGKGCENRQVYES